MSPGLDRFENFGHDELTAKYSYFRCSRPPDVDGMKMFDKHDQAAKCLKSSVSQPDHPYQTF